MRQAILITTVLLTTLSLAACGTRAKTTTNTSVSTTTTGQELTDLKRALDEGAITQAEYDKKRKEILKDG